jgi:hypothetical protein
MAEWRLAKSLVQLREQINALFPARDKESDGSVGDLRHQVRKSDHNPNSAGVVTAIDVDENLVAGGEASGLVSALRASKDPRIKYIIYEGFITTKGDVSHWKSYHGANPHRHHFHISVSSDRGLYDDATPWDLSGQSSIHPPSVTVPPAPFPTPQPELKLGAKGDAVKRLQLALRSHGFAMLTADGDFGPATLKAVKGFQASKNLRPDGIAGKMTNIALGL